jgi:betaine-aldehyde dehydrogenase
VIEYDRFFIGGGWEKPAGTGVIEIVSPHTEQVIGRAPEGTAADIDRAVAAASQAFDEGPWPATPAAERAAAVGKLAELFADRLDAMNRLITDEMGSPVTFGRMSQAMLPQMIYQYYADLGKEYRFDEERQGMLGPSLVRREPVGVVAAVVPWNVPQFLIASKLAPALVAGCTVVVKPAPETALDPYLLAELVSEAGIPDGVVNIVAAGREVGEHLVAHPDVDKVAFTGSTTAGRRIGEICGRQLKRCSLELGGKSAAVILDDADLDVAVPMLKLTGLLNNGEACIAQTRVLAPRSRYGEIVDALAAMVTSTVVGDPADEATEVGPLVARRQRERVEDYIASGTAEGARLVAGGGPAEQPHGWYVPPTLFADVDNGMRIAREEIFGPVLSVIPYTDEAEAVRIANDSEYGLAGSVWTADVDHGIEVASAVRTGTYGVNLYNIDICSPFGGFKASGVGREFGPEGLENYLETKSIAIPPR